MNQLPRYQQIKQYLNEKIQTRDWPVGFKIPTEIELADEFSVSRMTANKAIKELVTEGLLQRTPRLGTFVCHKKAESPLMEIRNIATEIRNRGNHYTNKIIVQQSIEANGNIALQIGVRNNTIVYFTQIVHYENNRPIQIEERWVNPNFAPSYIEQDFTKQTPNEYLVQTCPLSDIEHSVEAIIASPHIVELLDMDAYIPCLLLNRRTWSEHNLISVALLYHPGDRYKLTSRTKV
ncbi:histidine utilization repressor [Aliivibrio logei]|uniref:Histidine utilization repressor n=1 Tax=Aliivibrio logei TaxID=688 RepID=A0A1B9NTN5_ALILO|nr:histidine utilization repressor [Aliivibrio logei]OCH17055.1 histidine utilization repressor [Aliivibrio logei]